MLGSTQSVNGLVTVPFVLVGSPETPVGHVTFGNATTALPNSFPNCNVAVAVHVACGAGKRSVAAKDVETSFRSSFGPWSPSSYFGASFYLRRDFLMKLQRGITGFRHVGDEPLPEIDLRAFRTVFHEVACKVAATVVHNPRRNPNVECNFVDALLKTDEDEIVVLLNCVHPLVALTAKFAGGGPIEFRDVPALTAAFSDYPEYTVLSTEVLSQQPTADMLTLLGEAELEQCNYWKPTRLGDVIFNYWD